MITAVDTNIILDVLIPGEPFGESSKILLDRHLSKGKLIICEVVFAELAAGFESEKELEFFLADTGIGLVRPNEKASFWPVRDGQNMQEKAPEIGFHATNADIYFKFPARNVRQCLISGSMS